MRTYVNIYLLAANTYMYCICRYDERQISKEDLIPVEKLKRFHSRYMDHICMCIYTCIHSYILYR